MKSILITAIYGVFLSHFFVLKGASAKDLYEAHGGMGNTTDDIDFTEVFLRRNQNRRDLLWPYLNESSEDFSWDVDYYHRYQEGPSFSYKLHQLRGSATKRIMGKHEAKIGAGVFTVDEVGRTTKSSQIIGEFEFLSAFNKDLWTKVHIGRNPGVREIFLTGRGVEDLENTRIALTAQKQLLAEDLAIKIMYIKNFLKNGVERDFFDGEIMYSLMKYPHWARFGFGYHTLDYNKNRINYWTPLDFYAFGPRADLSYVFNDKIQAFFGGNYNWFEENNTFKGNGYYMRTGLKYGVRENFTIDLSYERNESVQNNNSWVAQAYYINGNLFW